VQDTDGAYRDWFSRHDVTTVLQRPDFHVFGTGRTPTDAGALLEQARSTIAAGVQHPAHDVGHDRRSEASRS
jgi:hypothetical protein